MGRDHEFLKIDVVIGMPPAVQFNTLSQGTGSTSAFTPLKYR